MFTVGPPPETPLLRGTPYTAGGHRFPAREAFDPDAPICAAAGVWSLLPLWPIVPRLSLPTVRRGAVIRPAGTVRPGGAGGGPHPPVSVRTQAAAPIRGTPVAKPHAPGGSMPILASGSLVKRGSLGGGQPVSAGPSSGPESNRRPPPKRVFRFLSARAERNAPGRAQPRAPIFPHGKRTPPEAASGGVFSAGTQTPDCRDTRRPRPGRPNPPAAGTARRPAACARTSCGSRNRRSSRSP